MSSGTTPAVCHIFRLLKMMTIPLTAAVDAILAVNMAGKACA
jgi:hypothetical protein